MLSLRYYKIRVGYLPRPLPSDVSTLHPILEKLWNSIAFMARMTENQKIKILHSCKISWNFVSMNTYIRAILNFKLWLHFWVELITTCIDVIRSIDKWSIPSCPHCSRCRWNVEQRGWEIREAPTRCRGSRPAAGRPAVSSLEFGAQNRRIL